MRISDWSSDVCSSDLNRIGLFLHIPWPPTRLLVSLPFHERLVEAMLHYDVIGFQRSEEHTSELQSLMRISYAVFCLKEKKRSCQKNSTYGAKGRKATVGKRQN